MSVKSTELFNKIKPFRLRRPEGDGHEREIEIREDEEQSVKLQEIIDLLVAAGYFRARIKGLSSFDKVVGGMTWCIESCNVEVDVDLLFQENSTIGQKIALTEKIVSVLPKLQCPHQIEPHQIQGLDFIHIFPVIQWLVKRTIEFRSDTSDFLYSFAIGQFNKEFQHQEKLSEKEKKLLKNVNVVREFYRPQRRFRRKNTVSTKDKDINSKVQITLLEYGCRNLSRTPSITNQDVSNPEMQEHEIQQMMNNMTITEEESFDFDALTEDEQKSVLVHYKNLNEEFEIYQSNEDEHLINLRERKNEIIDNWNKLKNRENQLDKEIMESKHVLKDLILKIEQNENLLNEFDKNVDSEKAREIENLIIESDTLKKKEITFRESCKNELEKLERSIEEAKKTKLDLFDQKNREIENTTKDLNEKISSVKLQVAKKSRAISILQRKIDDVPSRSELTQYQKRFIELYNQISAKHKETKQYYSLYNTLEDTRLYMNKELSLLNSICDNYLEAMLTREGRDEFLEQLTNILEGVKQSKMKLEKRLSEEKRTRDSLSSSLQILIELNRKYVSAIKQLKFECQKNEELLRSDHN